MVDVKTRVKRYWAIIKGAFWRVFWRVLWGSVALLVILILLFHGRVPTLEEGRTLVEIGAILTAGLWAYVSFVRERHGYPMTSSEHEITDLRLDGERTLLRVCVTLHNNGRVLVPLRIADIFVRQIRPFPSELERAIKVAREDHSEEDADEQIREGRLKGLFFQDADQGTVQWRELGYQELKWEEGVGTLEPGETEQFCADFIVSPKLDTVEVISAVKKVKEEGQYWVKRTVYNLEANDVRRRTGNQGTQEKGRTEGRRY